MSQTRNEIRRHLSDPDFSGSFQREHLEDPVNMARKVLRRERMWLRVLTAVTCLTWIAATGAAIWLAEFYFNEVQEQFVLQEYRFAKAHELIEGREWKELSGEEQRRYSQSRRFIDRVNDTLMLLTQATIVLAGAAALLSVWLVIASRRVALKQINVTLASLRENLDSLIVDERSKAEATGG